MGTSERSQPTLFDLGESERQPDQMWPTPTHHEERAEKYRLDTSHRHWQEKRQVHLAPLARDARMTPGPFRLTSSPGAIPASRSHTPGSDWARRMTAISGRRCAGYSTLRGPVGCSLKTLLGTSRWASTLFWLSWKRTATPAGRSLYRLVPSTPSTGATASGSWPTPRHIYGDHPGMTDESHLTGQAITRPFPTPDKGMADGGRALPEGTTPTGITPDGKKRQVGLTNAVKAWPTPRHEGFDAGGHRGTNDSLHSAVKAQPWGTPTSRDWKDGSSVGNVPENGLLGRQAVNRSGQTGMKLSGAWTLALMGFPPDWGDDLPPDPLGTTPT